MKISKHLHSCLLIEEQGKTLIVDPGIFTYQEKALEINKLEKLDYILITHEHPDHMHLPFVQELVAKFPQVKIITNNSIVTLLEKENIRATSEGDAVVQVENMPHEKLWDKEPPTHVIFTIFNKVTHAGDSHQITMSSDILALGIQAPWGSTTGAVNVALELHPKVIIPLHDWSWKDGFRQTLYQRLKDFFQTKGIDFKAVETGEMIEV